MPLGAQVLHNFCNCSTGMTTMDTLQMCLLLLYTPNRLSTCTICTFDPSCCKRLQRYLNSIRPCVACYAYKASEGLQCSLGFFHTSVISSWDSLSTEPVLARHVVPRGREIGNVYIFGFFNTLLFTLCSVYSLLFTIVYIEL